MLIYRYIYMYILDLVIDNFQRFICYKTQPNKQKIPVSLCHFLDSFT